MNYLYLIAELNSSNSCFFIGISTDEFLLNEFKKISIYGESHIEEVAKEHGYDVLAKIPIDPRLTALVDKGSIEIMDNNYLSAAADAVEGL